MKTILVLSLTLLASGSSQAQLLHQEAFNGAVLGGLIGGIIGHNTGRGHTGQGAAIGAASGLFLGALDSQARRSQYYYPPPAYYTMPVTTPTYYGPESDYQYGTVIQPAQPNYALPGAVLGGVVGGIVGNNTRRGNTASGVAIGAASGLVLGSLAQPPARSVQVVRVVQPQPAPPAFYNPAAPPVVYTPPAPSIPNAPTVPNAPQVPASPQTVTIINHYYYAPVRRW